MLKEKFEACTFCGAIGDAWGSSYENADSIASANTFFLGGKKSPPEKWQFTDDTMLTAATCEVLFETGFSAENLLKKFCEYYKNNKLIGLGSATLKAIKDTTDGFHWTQVGRKGEFAAGNGAAMRIAPFAFSEGITNNELYDACRITHNNDEAYAGALAVYQSIKAALNADWNGENNLFDIIIPQLPDTKLRDRLIELDKLNQQADIAEVAKIGNNGYVVNSVPFAIYCASRIRVIGLTGLFKMIIEAGGDTDTNASIAGQIAGTLIGLDGIPGNLLARLKSVPDFSEIKRVIDMAKFKIEE